ncbi:MAG: hypothetical protein M8860_11585 [marine benthic group bacterium]|nr:hypothetical protein [Candidatus Carthagonibacter metallireducens]MCL7968682.1 hypothetical protein [Gemmatimonadota bacterium]MCL7975675.1 hypothetical protein [Gemmatimonadota bacterium]MCL7985996.1 hypothetical protein [Gemmatimonadota bacterium]
MNARRWTVLGATVAFAFVVGACQEAPTEPETASFDKPAPVIENSNGAPSGKHYNLNIIGVPKTKTADMTGNNGHRIFVGLGRQGEVTKNTKILLTEGEFAVLDANGTDGEAAFQLPNPDPDCDGTTDYSVYVRALGKPGGSADMQTCYTDTSGTWCAADVSGGVSQITITRSPGKQKFSNESKDLLYVDYCTEWDTTTSPWTCLDWTIIPLFGEEVDEYYWDYDNNGLKLAQLRFYPISTVAWTDEEVVCSDES